MSSNKAKTLTATALLLLSPLTTNYCGAGTPPLNPKLVSLYKRIAAIEDGFPKPSPKETSVGRNLEMAAYVWGTQDSLNRLQAEFVQLLPDVYSANPETIKKRREIVLALQEQYGVTAISVPLQLEDSTGLFQYHKNRIAKLTSYLHRHPSLHLTALEAAELGPYLRDEGK